MVLLASGTIEALDDFVDELPIGQRITNAERIYGTARKFDQPLTEARSKSVKRKLDELLVRTNSRYKSGDYQGAIEDCNAILAVDGISTDLRSIALYNRAECEYRSKDHQGSIEDCNAILSMDGVSEMIRSNTHIKRSAIRCIFGDYQGAVEDCNAVLAMDGISIEAEADAIYNRGGSRYKSGDYQGSIQDCSTTLSMDGVPTIRRIHSFYHRAISRLKIRDYEGSIEDCNAILSMDGVPTIRRIHILRCRGISRFENRDYQRSIQDHNAILAMDGVEANERAYALHNRVCVKINLKDYQGAIEDCNAILAIGDAAEVNERSNALHNRGLANIELGNFQLAIDDWLAVLEMGDAPTRVKDEAARDLKGLIEKKTVDKNADEDALSQTMDQGEEGITAVADFEANSTGVMDLVEEVEHYARVKARQNIQQDIEFVEAKLKQAQDILRDENPPPDLDNEDKKKRFVKAINDGILKPSNLRIDDNGDDCLMFVNPSRNGSGVIQLKGFVRGTKSRPSRGFLDEVFKVVHKPDPYGLIIRGLEPESEIT